MKFVCLIVDDETSIQEFVTTILSDAGVNSSCCATVDTMLRAVADQKPNLIFLDAALEGSDAVDALRRLALSGYKGRVQLISGRGPDLLQELRQVGEEYGLEMQTPLQKPFSALQIMASLKREAIVSATSVFTRSETPEIKTVNGKPLSWDPRV